MKKSEDLPIVIKGVPRHALKAQASPLPMAAPHLEHFQVFFFSFFLLLLRHRAAQRSPKDLFSVIETKTTSFWPFIYICIYILFFSF